VNGIELALTRLVLNLVAIVAQLLPLRAEVLFASSRDRALGPQLAAVAEALRTAAPELRQRHALAPYGYGLGAKVRYLLHLIGATWTLQRAEITILDNAWLPAHITPRRQGSSVVQIWHAEGAYKRFGHAARGTSTAADGALSDLIHGGYSAALVSSEFVRPAYAEAFRLPLEHVHATGPLRGAWLASQEEVARRRAALIEQYPALNGRRVLLYAPTFRGRGSERTTTLNIAPDAIAAALPDNWVVLIKAHPLVPISGHLQHPSCMTVDQRIPVDELFPIADALFTDYSSSIFLWSLLERPLLLAVDDVASYERDPGLFFDPRSSDSIGVRVSSAADVAAVLTGSGGGVSQATYRAFAERYLGPRGELSGAAARAAALILDQRGGEDQRRSEGQRRSERQ